MPEPFLTFLNQAMSQGSRSTVLKPLGWLVGILCAATIATFSTPAPVWVGATFAGLTFLSVFLYLAAYIYFGITDKDSLRSEKYSIQKLAIQKGFIGDDQAGYIPIEPRNVTPSIKSLPTNEQEGSEEA